MTVIMAARLIERPRIPPRAQPEIIPTPMECAERGAVVLAAAIINQAFKDLEHWDEEIAKEAAAWLHSKAARGLMSAVGILANEEDIDAAIERVLDHGIRWGRLGDGIMDIHNQQAGQGR